METIPTVRLLLRTGLIAGLLLFSALLAAVLLAPVRAQETPTPTPEEEEPPVEPALLRVNLPDEVIAAGEEFTVELLAENVEHLAGFNFTIEYPAQAMSYVGAADLGQFVTSAGRQVACDCSSVRRTPDWLVGTCVVTVDGEEAATLTVLEYGRC